MIQDTHIWYTHLVHTSGTPSSTHTHCKHSQHAKRLLLLKHLKCQQTLSTAVQSHNSYTHHPPNPYGQTQHGYSLAHMVSHNMATLWPIWSDTTWLLSGPYGQPQHGYSLAHMVSHNMATLWPIWSDTTWLLSGPYGQPHGYSLAHMVRHNMTTLWPIWSATWLLSGPYGQPQHGYSLAHMVRHNMATLWPIWSDTT